MKLPVPFGCLLFLVCVVALNAAPVVIGDHSFEDNPIGVGGYTYNLAPERTGTGGSNNANAFEESIAGFAAQGTDHLGMEQGYEVWQDLAVTYQANTRYTLTVAVGNRSGNTELGNASQYLLADSTGTIHATGAFDASTLPAGSFADAPDLVFDTPALASPVGSTIRIVFRAGGNGRSHFDNIRLDAVALKPSGTATVTNLNATSVTARSATLNGTVAAIGNSVPSVSVCWGLTDGGVNPASWQYQTTLPGTQSGSFALPVSSLVPASTYRFTVRATNSAGASWVTPSAAFETTPDPPVVATSAATGIGPASATLAANVSSNGGEDPVVIIYYGPSNGGTNPSAWASSVTLGSGSGPMTATVSGLTPSLTYHFRAFAGNSGGDSWAPTALSFSTSSVTTPVVENRDTEGITGTTANLRGEIVYIGSSTPTVTLFYGTTDGGTNAVAWSSSASMGPQTGGFSRFVSNLLPNRTYFLRWRATNAGGTTWSDRSGSFVTTALVPSTVVINEIHYNPADNTSLEEFIELHNPGDSAINLSGWSLSDAVSHTIPAGTMIAAGGYLVICQNPATILSKFGISGAQGPWTGNLSADGERIDLRDPAGVLKDRVEYGSGFPWPTGADGNGESAELIHPSLDNDLGGSWRSSVPLTTSPVVYVASQAANWKYKKGTAEASNPVDAWRSLAYNDGSWLTGQAEIGYKNGNSGYAKTTLSDMYKGYGSVYFRKTFTVASGSIPRQLKLRIHIDDGCIVWINGKEVGRWRVGAGQIPYNAFAANHDRAWEEISINNADTILVGGTNVIAVHGFNTRIDSSDFSMNLELSSVANSLSPSPGITNTAKRATHLIAPQIRQVAHTPESPLPNTPVTITARITDPDGMGAVNLAYQTVNPGSYIRLTDTAYQTSWTTVAMLDNGTGGDALAGDSTYTAVLPSALQTHRRLVRYRISFSDSIGNTQTVPYADDEQPNFAYFVYSGVPAWTGAMRPTSYNGFPATGARTYPSTLLASMPPFHLIANATDVSNCQYDGAYSTTRFRGTVVQRGVVHDHIQFRVRGIGSTYVSGKNKWNFYFNRARDYQGYDNHGKPYKKTWNNLLVNGNASPWASVHRGSAGVEEAVSHRIFQLAGMAAMNTQFLHLRVVDGSSESGTDQYSGDLWGLYLGLEPTEGNFLDERDLADGNLYSIEGSSGDKKHQSAVQTVDSSDWNAFRDGVSQSGQTEAWYRANVDLPALYTFLAINRLIGNVDVRPGDNYRFYHRPGDNRWVIIPYDMDMQFIAAHHWGGTMDGVVAAGAPAAIMAISRHPNLAREFRNRCREILSLMASDGSTSGGQIGQLIGEYARFVNPPGQALTWADLDAAMWNLHPRTEGGGENTGQSSHKGNFFRAGYLDGGRGGLGGTSSTGTWIRSLPDSDSDGFSDHEGLMQWLVNYATNTWPGGTWNRKAMTGIGTGSDPDPNRQLGYGYKYLEFECLHGGWIDGNVNPGTAPHTDFPNKPVAVFNGGAGYPSNALAFSSSAFSDPQGAASYAAHEWRVAEIQAPGIPGYIDGQPFKYEMEPLWSSGEITSAPGAFAIPLGIAKAGKTYRVRVRHKDNAGNWSYWSNPVQFAATTPQATLIHYWNFNDSSSPLAPTITSGSGTLDVNGTWEPDTGQDFSGENARNGDAAGSHLRVNNPLTSGTRLELALPATGYENLMVRYETRRSSQGAAIQEVSYTLNGTDYLPLANLAIVNDDPQVVNLDFRNIAEVDHNHSFGIRIEFRQGSGGTAGNNRFDNLTVEGDALPPSYESWKHTAFPNPVDWDDENVSGPDANPSGDGVANLIRYALGIGPHDPVTGLLPSLAHDGANLVFRFRYDPGKPDLIWKVLATSDAASWTQAVFDSESDPIPQLVDGWLPVPVPAHLGPGPAADPRMFLRLQVTLRP